MTQERYKDQIVWIIGASSGIGLALARVLAEQGAILALSARRNVELEALRLSIGAAHKVFILDVTDADGVYRTASTIQAVYGRIDRVIFLAAAYSPMQLCALNQTLLQQIVQVNLVGAFNVVQAIIPIFKNQKFRGQLALCGSVAGYMGLPGGQPYSATKAAIISLAESLYAECSDDFDVKLISPGFVRTPLTNKNSFKMPMIVEPIVAATAIADGLLTRRFEIHFPKKFTYLLKLLRLLPYQWSLRLTRNIKN